MNTLNTIENNQITESIEMPAADNTSKTENPTYAEQVKGLCEKLQKGEIDVFQFSAMKAEIDKTSASAITAQYEGLVKSINTELQDLTFKIEYLKAALSDVAAAVNSFGISEIAGVKLIGKTILNGTGEKPAKRAPAAVTSDFPDEYTLKIGDVETVFHPDDYKTFSDLIEKIAPEIAKKHEGASMYKVFRMLVEGKIENHIVSVRELSDDEISARKAAKTDKKGL